MQLKGLQSYGGDPHLHDLLSKSRAAQVSLPPITPPRGGALRPSRDPGAFYALLQGCFAMADWPTGG